MATVRARSGSFAVQHWWVVLALVLALPGCSEKTPTPPKDAGSDSAPDVEPVDGTDGLDIAPDSAIEDVPDGSEPADIGTDAVVNDDSADVPEVPVDVSECSTATDCTKLTLSPCQQAVCESGTCKAVAKPDACCTDTDCDDKVECTTNKCDTDTHTCTYNAIVNCCSGKVTLLKTGLEQGFEQDFKDTAGPTNGNVHWQVGTTRVHSGKSALYFGNECHSYDNTAKGEDACKGGGEATAISTVLNTKDYVLPKDKKAQLHFWLWLDAEPLYTTTLPAGQCANPCPTGSSCLLIGGSSQCVPEKDVLQVNILTDNKVLPAFNSTSIGKTTKGAWQHIAVDLSGFAGQSIKLQWAFNTGTGLKNGYEGVYLDDIVVETICATSGAVCDAKTPCPDDGIACTTDICTGYANAVGSGACFFDKKLGCCAATSDCDDGNSCTVDACNSGQCQQTPDATKAGCCKPAVLSVDDFDGGTLDVWTTLNMNSNAVKWRVDPTGGTASSASLYFGNEQFTGYDDGKDLGPKGTICTKPFMLSKGAVYNLAVFDLNLETEWTGQAKGTYVNPPIPGKPKNDVLTVQVYSDGQFADAWSTDAIAGSTEGLYLPVTVALDAWQGKQVQVCLTFDSGDGKQNAFGGAHIDNFAVNAACTKKGCYFDNECGNLSCGGCETASCTATGCACAKIAGCCKIDGDCNDNDDKCTADTCNANACVFTPTGAEGCAP